MAIGDALSRVVDGSAWEDLVPLVCDPRHGDARQMLVAAVGQMRQPRADDVLLALLRNADAEIVAQALRALGRRRSVRARPDVAAFLAHQDRAVRHAALWALAWIDRAREVRRPAQPHDKAPSHRPGVPHRVGRSRAGTARRAAMR